MNGATTSKVGATNKALPSSENSQYLGEFSVSRWIPGSRLIFTSASYCLQMQLKRYACISCSSSTQQHCVALCSVMKCWVTKLSTYIKQYETGHIKRPQIRPQISGTKDGSYWAECWATAFVSDKRVHVSQVFDFQAFKEQRRTESISWVQTAGVQVKK